jgi:hypothetical protein
MSRQMKEDLENIYESMNVIEDVLEEKQSMKVGSGSGTTATTGDLEGPAKEQNKGTGAENSDVPTAPDAEAGLQGDTVEKSKKGGKAPSKFDELYKQVQDNVVEEEMGGDVEDSNFNDAIGDFPPAGADEEAAERLGDEEAEGGSIKDLFGRLADIMAQIGDKLGEDEVEEGEVISDETEIADGEEIAGEAVESTPAPDSTAKLQSKGNMNVKGVKVVKKAVSSASSGQEDGGKPKNQADSNLGPKTSLKSNGSGAAVDGKDASAFE